MELCVLNLKLIIYFVFLMNFRLQMLNFIQIVLNQRDVLFVIKLVNLNLKLWMVSFKLINNRVQNISLPLNFIILNFELTLSFLKIFQLQKEFFVSFFQDLYI